ncbi:MAG: DUF4412 domain-containing protein [bacterium]|nr:DUF4412 domain-containing protein [bacterium]
MKTTLILLFSLFMSAHLQSQNGTYLEYKISSGTGHGGSIKMNASEYGSLSEFSMVIPQMPGGGMITKSLIQKSHPGIIYSINDKNKSYSEITPSEASGQDSKTYSVKKLGSETVNGYKCVHALITEGTETHEVWNTKDFADYSKYSEVFAATKKMGSAKRDQALKDAGCEGLPVKMVHKGNKQEGDMTMELVKLEKRTYAKADFEIPAGFTKSASSGSSVGGVKSQQELMNMTPEERAKYIEEMKKQYGGGK